MNSHQGKGPESKEQTAAHGKNFQRAKAKPGKTTAGPAKNYAEQNFLDSSPATFGGEAQNDE